MEGGVDASCSVVIVASTLWLASTPPSATTAQGAVMRVDIQSLGDGVDFGIEAFIKERLASSFADIDTPGRTLNVVLDWHGGDEVWAKVSEGEDVYAERVFSRRGTSEDALKLAVWLFVRSSLHRAESAPPPKAAESPT